ncbi:uncharacterized protein Z518_02657 [Rhinocladiella mackenziei CBS 650.93]|uniref:Rhinocladiella mackenziei CBS 650.93 unplaced genomic scaffold supercont1.2, whole genome shotgun sequence n=1 Tax=Rhinocladiella mackenziei CBS 650.93 TaxID=1442369 RepID=A0A0D2G0J4_9EURO|nr:uncharacterized protein Z518_02657 [Rhinocladiella mackenziei CBS 650.93]KIX08002.1 hypothetical protein Z518_02657 [Rhinocladiella mackenziei CBS 650.93]
MIQLGLLVLFFVAGSIAFTAVDAFLSSRRHARQAKESGCQAPPRFRHKWPWGMDNVLRLIQADKEHRVPQEVMKTYHEAGHATFILTMPGRTNIVTHDPKNIQAVLATQFDDFELGPQRRNNFYPMLGVGIFTADAQRVVAYGFILQSREHSRAALRPQFVREQISDLELEERHIQTLFQHLPVDSSGWTAATDLGPIFFRLTLDTATEFLFGESVHAQSAALPPNASALPTAFNHHDIGADFDHGTSVLGIRSRLAGLYWLYNPPSFRNAIRAVHRFADDCIERAAQDPYSDKTNDRYVFLKELLKLTDDKIEIRTQLLNIFLAGRDTTAGLLGWTFWELARHPEVFRKLRATILENFGPYGSNKKFTFATLKSCTYLQYVMNETLRLYPSVPLNFRQATRDTTLPRGGGPDGMSPVYVQRGQEVNYSVYVMHRRRDIWGPDADEFVPERWSSRRFGWEYLPFNGGPRVCLGQQFALTEAGYVICRILQRFDAVEKSVASDEELHQYSLTTAPLTVMVKLHQAAEADR